MEIKQHPIAHKATRFTSSLTSGVQLLMALPIHLRYNTMNFTFYFFRHWLALLLHESYLALHLGFLGGGSKHYHTTMLLLVLLCNAGYSNKFNS